MTGILILNKPKGVSSNKVLYYVKNCFKGEKIGHLGTLDPMATGVLPICVGKATKLFDYFLSKTKTYKAVFTFGTETDTLDSEGKVVTTSSVIPTKQQILEVLPKLTGSYQQLPPKFSAKSINGVRAYELSRKGIDFELKPKLVTINNFELLKQINGNSFEFLIDCSSGTYIRSIARDLAKMLNTVAYMSDLNRIRVGVFDIKNAVNVDEINSDKLLKIEDVLCNVEKINIDAKHYDKLKNGVKINVDIDNKNNVLVFCNNKLFGLADIIDKKLYLKIYLLDEGR